MKNTAMPQFEVYQPDFATLTTRLAAISEYRVLFSMTFGDSTVSEARIQSALAQFVRSIQSFDSKFDAGRAQVANNNVNFPNFTAQENLGRQIFLGQVGNPPATCAACSTRSGWCRSTA